MDYKIKSKELENLANLKFNKEKEKIETEIKSNLKEIMGTLAQRRNLYSGYMFEKALEIHKERIERLLNLRLEIDLEVFYKDLSIETDNDINFLFGRIEQIANRQKEIILPNVEPILKRMNQIDKFREEINREVDIILADIKRSLMIKKEENILLGKKKIKEANLNSEKSILKEFEYLLESIENEKLKKILLRDFKHAIFCLENELWKPCVVLCGGILEGVLGVEFLIKGKLEQKIKKAKAKGIILEEIEESLAQVLRVLRNFVHIEKEVKKDYKILEEDANISLQVVKKIFKQIKKFKDKESLEFVKGLSRHSLIILRKMKEINAGLPITSSLKTLIKTKRNEFEELVKRKILIPCNFDESIIKNPETQRKAIELQQKLNCHPVYKLSEKGFKLLEKIDS